ncbi:methyltransferase type 11 [Rufibacter sp. DG15C]|uniref:class I SAM-dependent methyltransferase n=1 Tax=Rufibacter sp. DG15C TaxID=1379909 RepID=UPI00078DB70A|nr:class I SAM-dependent methyltransferase [Rufibacter sp. DG15C]AMM51617.1 methyltransferase type 11 [Rufibacter sp. DG15C]
MDIQQAYNLWSTQYDTNKNRTRDLEERALQEMADSLHFERCLEIGCGTGKNTTWLATRAQQVTAVDFSENMLAKAKQKVTSPIVEFRQADITQAWQFANGLYDLVTFSLVLEHIEQLEPIFQKAAQVLPSNGYVYVGELHPFKQYAGTKARFDTPNGRVELTCFTHHVCDFIQAAQQNGLALESMQEYFDGDDRSTTPRILALFFKKA